MAYSVTFGSQYSHEVHPVSRLIHPDGWVSVEADDEGTARELIVKVFAQRWSFAYAPGELETEFFPLGEIGRIDAAGVLTLHGAAV